MNGTLKHLQTMHKKNNLMALGIGLVCVLLSCFCSCQSEELPAPTVQKEKTMLAIQLGTPSERALTRGVSDDPKNTNNTWTDAERLVDGDYLYRVTILLVDGNYNLVGYKDFDSEIRGTTNTTEVSTTFTNLEPSTTYKMIAVANYSAIDSWSGLPNFPDLGDLVVGSNIASIVTQLNAYKMPEAGSDLVVSKSPQPLTLVQDVTTPASGSMTIGGELLRTYARLRIEVANRSEKYNLNVNSLKFGAADSYFGYNIESLLPVDDAHIPTANGRITESSSDALTPFTYSLDNPLQVPQLDLTGATQNSKVVFDGYLYECQNTKGFKYSLNLGYPITSSSTKTVYVKGSAQNAPTDYNVGLYLIGYGNNNQFLTATETGMVGTQITETQLDETQYQQAIWSIYRSGSTIRIQSVMNSKYINIANNSATLGYSQNLTVNSSNGRISQGNYYLYANGTSITGHRRNQTSFKFYPLTLTTINDSETLEAKEFNIPLETIINGVPQTTTFIRRNDFINVLVTVSYNENSNAINFHVSDWNSKQGDIEFD